ncbi:acetyltransferase, GNAT family [Lactobacillus selangorensis]|uniref:Acetyltransferase, GNAT family n=1 Tax=Lactobacillus selangorensis TaxID=81857 RepID=A0A0R2FQL4_9LACO|nr:GNAT family N-acetyltransferase [Lactobacillus selangorensis]KRN27655.1 acetyltransferase, GNAT family [Lactobacillus selangorensis]KRN30378.1 acetyltransferase, GNAT family [Lactobacillus selangorensis]
MEIRAAKKADVDEVLPLIKIVFDEMEMPIFEKIPDQDLYHVLSEAYATEDYRYSYRHTTVAVEDGHVVGIAVGYPEVEEATIDDAIAPFLPEIGLSKDLKFFTDKEARPGEWYLDTLAVAENKQGHGIGTALLKYLPEHLRQQGEQVISLSVDFENPQAEKLYKRMGFVEDGELMIGNHRYKHLIEKL